MNCVQFHDRGILCYGYITGRTEEIVDLVLFEEISYVAKANGNVYLKGMSEMVLLTTTKSVLKSSIIRDVYILLDTLFTTGEMIFRYGMLDIFWTKSTKDELHNEKFMIPYLTKSLAWKSNIENFPIEFFSFLLFRQRLVKAVQSHLASKKGRGRQTTVPKISCTLSDYYALLDSAKSSVARDFKQNSLVVNNVHSINGGVQKLIGIRTTLEAHISCPTLLDALLGFRCNCS